MDVRFLPAEVQVSDTIDVRPGSASDCLRKIQLNVFFFSFGFDRLLDCRGVVAGGYRQKRQ